MTDILTDGLTELDRHIEAQEDVGTDEPAAEVVETTEEVATETTEDTTTPTTDERPRNPDGTFAKTEPEPAAKTEQEEKFESYLSRFGTDPAALTDLPPELQKAIQAGFEADGMTGRQGQELGELKKLLEQVQAQTAPQPGQPAQYDPEAIQDHFAEHPENILPTLQQAYLNEDMNLVYLAIGALDDVNRPLAEGLRVEIAKRAAIAEMSPHIERNQQQDFNMTFTTAWNTVKADHPDIDQFADQIVQAAQDDPELARGLNEGTPESQQKVLTSLYKIAAFDAARQDGSTLAQAKATATAEQAAEADQAKKEGFVATGSQRVEPEQKSAGESWLESLDFDKHASKFYAND